MDRRQFLEPKHLLQAAGAVHAALGEGTSLEPAESSAEAFLLHFTRPAMATVFETVLPFGTPRAYAAASEALDLIDALEAQMTVYRDDSAVSQINQRAAFVAIPVEEKLFSLIRVAERITRESGGAFDIATGQLVKAWGFFRGPPRVPRMEEIAEALTCSGMQHLTLDAEQHTVLFDRVGVEINLGSIGKGYALDRAAEQLVSGGIHDALLHGGRSSVLAMGSAPGSTSGWTIGIKHPWNEEERLATVRLQDQALGTSAATFKHLVHEGRKLGHILDPRTGWPAYGVASASAIAPTAAEADALATAFFVRGVEFAREYCETHPSIGALLLLDGKKEPILIGAVKSGCTL